MGTADLLKILQLVSKIHVKIPGILIAGPVKYSSQVFTALLNRIG